MTTKMFILLNGAPLQLVRRRGTGNQEVGIHNQSSMMKWLWRFGAEE